MKPIGNGVAEILDTNSKSKEWFCIELVGFLSGTDWDTYHLLFKMLSLVTAILSQFALVINEQLPKENVLMNQPKNQPKNQHQNQPKNQPRNLKEISYYFLYDLLIYSKQL